MEESNIRLQAIGAPFNLEQSSCGTRVPRYFKWTSQDQKTKVFIDHALHCNLNGNPDGRYGWTCESKAIAPNVIQNIKNNIDIYKKHYLKIFTFDEELVSMDSSFFNYCYPGSNTPWTPEEDYGLHEKNKLVSFLCSNNSMTEGHRFRLNWAERLKDQVDLYGGACGSQIIGGSHWYHHRKKTEALKDYMFSITIENNVTDCYFTEKLTDCFANSVVPVYRGSKNICRHFDANGIIFLEDDFDVSRLSSDLYYSKLDSVKRNLEIVKKMNTADDFLYLKIMNI